MTPSKLGLAVEEKYGGRRHGRSFLLTCPFHRTLPVNSNLGYLMRLVILLDKALGTILRRALENLI